MCSQLLLKINNVHPWFDMSFLSIQCLIIIIDVANSQNPKYYCYKCSMHSSLAQKDCPSKIIIFSKCDRIWENPTFYTFHKNWDFAIFSIYDVWITSVLKYEHLQFYHQWATALYNAAIILPVLMAVNFHVLILKIEHYSKYWVFADPVTNKKLAIAWKLQN